MKSLIRNSFVYRFWCHIRELVAWRKRQYAAPSPHFIKQVCLARNGLPNATWVETGTFLGQTTQYLSTRARHVYSIEPEPTLFANAEKRFKNCANVKILHGTSEAVFPGLLPIISGDVNFWLDGHYSAGITFKGEQDTPIVDELESISANISRFGRICVLVDDIRCFNPQLPEYATYPSLDVLIDWARANGLLWHIEHDIFVARTAPAR